MKIVQVHLIIWTTLGITVDDRFPFDTYVSDLCKKSELQLKILKIWSPFIAKEERKYGCNF